MIRGEALQLIPLHNILQENNSIMTNACSGRAEIIMNQKTTSRQKNKRPRERKEAPNLPKKMAGTDRTIHYDLHRTKPSPKVSGAI